MRELINTITSKTQDSTIEGFLDKMYDYVDVEYQKLNNDQFAPIISATYKCYNNFKTYFNENSVKLDEVDAPSRY